MVSVSEEAIARAICKCWNTIYSDSSIGMTKTGKGQGFNVRDLIDSEFQIDFQTGKEWWLLSNSLDEAKKIVKQKLTKAGLYFAKLRVYGSVCNVSEYGDSKFVVIYKITFTEKI